MACCSRAKRGKVAAAKFLIGCYSVICAQVCILAEIEFEVNCCLFLVVVVFFMAGYENKTQIILRCIMNSHPSK